MMALRDQTATFVVGLSLRTTRAITSIDMTHFCSLLNARKEYAGVCTFFSDHDSIVFKYCDPEWYKVIEFNIRTWDIYADLKCAGNVSFITRLKAYDGAPLFTVDELRVWEECFAQIGILTYGRCPFPSGTSLLPKRRRQYSEFV